MRTLILLVFAFMLSACGTPVQREPFDTRGYSPAAWNDYNAINNAWHVVAVRAPYLDANSPLVEGLKVACRKGQDVTVVLYVGGRQTANAVAGTCVRVYLSNYPTLQSGPAVILVDGVLLTVNGQWVASNDKTTMQEYRFQEREKLLGQRIL